MRGLRSEKRKGCEGSTHNLRFVYKYGMNKIIWL